MERRMKMKTTQVIRDTARKLGCSSTVEQFYTEFIHIKETTDCQVTRAIINIAQTNYKDFDKAIELIPKLKDIDLQKNIDYFQDFMPILKVSLKRSQKSCDNIMSVIAFKCIANLLSTSDL